MASSLNVALLLHMDGANGSTSFPDSSLNNLTVTANVGAEISTAQSKFGGASSSLEVSGKSGDYLTLENNAALSLSSSNDFTIDCWVRPISFFGLQTIFSTGDVAVDGFRFSITSSQGLEVDDFSGNIISDTSATGTLSVNTWHHVALSVENNTWRVFLDGVLQGSGTRTASYSNNANMFIGQSLDSVPRDRLAAFVDEYRIVTNEADFTANFTPPTSAYADPDPNDAAVMVSLPGPLAPPEVVSTVALPSGARVAIASPLAPPFIVASLTDPPPEVIVSIPSPLTAPRIRAVNDFTSLIGNETTDYVLRISGDPIVELVMSSWQATLQRDRQSFVQAIVPGFSQYGSVIADRLDTEEFSIYRTVESGGQSFESLMASAPLSTVLFNEGSYNESATIQGFTDEFIDAPDGQGGPSELTGVQLISASPGGATRIRAEIDWFLRPGQSVMFNEYTFIAEYINYYVIGAGNSYMDVGDRGSG